MSRNFGRRPIDLRKVRIGDIKPVENHLSESLVYYFTIKGRPCQASANHRFSSILQGVDCRSPCANQCGGLSVLQ